MNVWVLSLTFESFKKFEQEEQRKKKETYQHNIMRSGDFSDSPEADLLFFGFDLGLDFEHLNITLALHCTMEKDDNVLNCLDCFIHFQ